MFDTLGPAIVGLIKKELARAMPAFSWGTVTSLSPLTVQLDRHRPEAPATLAGLSNLAGPLQVGKRVSVVRVAGRGMVLGPPTSALPTYRATTLANLPAAAPDGSIGYVDADNGHYVRTGGVWQALQVVEDTGWVNVTVLPGFASQGTLPVQVRRVGTLCTLRWGISSTGLSASQSFFCLQLPAGFYPKQNVYIPIAGNSASTGALAVIDPSGLINLRTGPALSSYYIFDAVSWYTD